MQDSTKAIVAANVSNSLSMASTWVNAAADAAFALYLALPADQQEAIVNHLPVPPWAIPIVTFALRYAARNWPQPALTATVASDVAVKTATAQALKYDDTQPEEKKP